MLHPFTRACVAVGFLAAFLPAHADGNSRRYLKDAFGNWVISESEALPGYKEDIPDGVEARGLSDRRAIAVELRCLTRKTSNEVPTYAISIRGIMTASDFNAVFSTTSNSAKIPMISLRQPLSTTFDLKPESFVRVLDMFSRDEEVKVSFAASSGQMIVLFVRGSTKLRSLQGYCEKLTS